MKVKVELKVKSLVMDVKIYQAIVEQSLWQKALITDAEYKHILVQIFINKFNSGLVDNILLYV